MCYPKIAILVTLAMPVLSFSQSGPQPAKELTQVSAVVTDRQGRLVEGLTIHDFLVKEDNDQPPLDSFSRGKTGAIPGTLPVPKIKAANDPGVSGTEVPPDVSRVIALVVDAASITHAGMETVKAALLNFVNEQATDQDLIALMTTSGKPGVSGEFTKDRNKLREAIKRLRPGRARTDSFLTPALCGKVVRREPQAVTLAMQIIESEEYTTGSFIGGGSGDPQAEAASKCMMLLLEAATRRRAVTSSIRAAAERLEAASSQRVIALFSAGFSMIAPGGEIAIDDVRPAMSTAAHSGVMVYCFDARVALDTRQINIGSLHLTSEMNDAVRDYQHGVALLASQTGGEAFFNIDSLSACMRKMLDGNAVCYRLSYATPQDKNPKAYRSITVSVKDHPEYHVRAAKGYVLADLRRRQH
jgi:VWFA-related protein